MTLRQKFAGLALASSLLAAPIAAFADQGKEATRAFAIDFVETVMNRHEVDALGEFVAPDVAQHAFDIDNGADALGDHYEQLFTSTPDFFLDVKRSLVDGEMVVLHSQQTVNKDDRGRDMAPTSFARFDIFRVRDGKIVEMWRTVQPVVPAEAHKNKETTMFNGLSRVSSDKSTTEANRATVVRFFEEATSKHNLEILDELLSENYIQHNVTEVNGGANLKKSWAIILENLNYNLSAEFPFILAEGDLVFTHGDFSFGGTRLNIADLFRLQDGIMVEHWDAIDGNVPEETASGNSVFGSVK